MQQAIGIEALPASVRSSPIFTDIELAALARVTALPQVDPTFEDNTLKNIILYYSLAPDEMEKELHRYAKTLVGKNNVEAAWQVLLASDSY